MGQSCNFSCMQNSADVDFNGISSDDYLQKYKKEQDTSNSNPSNLGEQQQLEQQNEDGQDQEAKLVETRERNKENDFPEIDKFTLVKSLPSVRFTVQFHQTLKSTNTRHSLSINLLREPKFYQENLESLSGKIRIYHGDWFERLPDGRGEEFIINNTNELVEYYRGQFFEGQRSVLGILITSDGNMYEGAFKEGKVTGKGRMVIKEVAFIEGDFVDGVLDDYGVEKDWKDKWKYEGQWKAGKREGSGKIEWVFIDKKKKEDEEALQEGKQKERKLPSAEFHDTLNEFYEGEFIQDKFDGEGTYQWKNCSRVYKGSWSKGKMNGKGVFVWNDGRRYIGQYVNDQKHGKGKMIWPDGRAWKGMWKRGQMHGKGKFFSFKKNNVSNLTLSKKDELGLAANNASQISHQSKRSQQSMGLIITKGIWENGKHSRWRTEKDSDSNDSENEEDQKQQLQSLKKKQLRDKQFVNQSGGEPQQEFEKEVLLPSRFNYLNKFVKSAINYIDDKSQPLKQSYIEAKDYVNDEIERKKRKWEETEQEKGVFSRFKQFMSPAKYEPPPLDNDLPIIQEETKQQEIVIKNPNEQNLQVLVQTINEDQQQVNLMNEEQMSQRSELRQQKFVNQEENKEQSPFIEDQQIKYQLNQQEFDNKAIDNELQYKFEINQQEEINNKLLNYDIKDKESENQFQEQISKTKNKLLINENQQQQQDDAAQKNQFVKQTDN